MNNCAFERGKQCIALREKKCLLCPFYKTEEQLEEGRKKARNRIRHLPEGKQKIIKTKYSVKLGDR